jgi:hypothetical protein
MDFNDADPQRVFDVIPADTIATLHVTVRPGNAGDGGLLRRSKDGNSEALDCEFTVVDGPYAKRKVWGLFTLVGTTPNHATAAEISRSRLRAILESARGIRPDDMSTTAKQARQVAGYRDFDGLRFVGRIGIEPARDGYPARNVLLEAITPDRRDWHPVEQIVKNGGAAAPVTGAGTTPPKPEPTKIEKPQWARKAS